MPYAEMGRVCVSRLATGPLLCTRLCVVLCVTVRVFKLASERDIILRISHLLTDCYPSVRFARREHGGPARQGKYD